MNETCVECRSLHSMAQVASEPLALLAARAGCALEASIVRCANSEDQTLGHLEVQVAHDVKELLRSALERGAQAKADGTPPLCPVCQQKLTRLLHLLCLRTNFQSTFFPLKKGLSLRMPWLNCLTAPLLLTHSARHLQSMTLLRTLFLGRGA